MVKVKAIGTVYHRGGVAFDGQEFDLSQEDFDDISKLPTPAVEKIAASADDGKAGKKSKKDDDAAKKAADDAAAKQAADDEAAKKLTDEEAAAKQAANKLNEEDDL
jgi:hypothetical protein